VVILSAGAAVGAMTVKNHIYRDALNKAMEQFSKFGGRIYVLSLVGIVIGVVGLKLVKD
jgi:hypothetical protein